MKYCKKFFVVLLLSIACNSAAFSISADFIAAGTLGGTLALEYVAGKTVLEKPAAPVPYLLDSSEVNAFDRLSMQPYSKPLDTTASVLQFAIIATPAVFAAAPSDTWSAIGFQYAETMMLAQGFAWAGKLLFDRARPYTYFAGAPSDALSDGDWLCSTPSGHATRSFAAAVFTATTFCSIFPESKAKIPVVAATVGSAAAVAILRVMSGNHFATDVIAGAALGSFCGFIVPWLHSNTRIFSRDGKGFSAAFLPGAISFTLAL